MAVKYTVSTFTGGIDGAGTNADVFLTIHGESGKTDEVYLDNPGHDDFEPGEHDVFKFSEKNVGEVKKITIRHDNSGEYPGWFLKNVIIQHERSNKKWECPCNKWLAVDEGDGKIERTLECSET